MKSAAELGDKLATDTVSKKPQQPIIKRNGWVSQKAQPVIVHLPTVPLTPKKRGRDGKRVPLTFDDLPAIRKKVTVKNPLLRSQLVACLLSSCIKSVDFIKLYETLRKSDLMQRKKTLYFL